MIEDYIVERLRKLERAEEALKEENEALKAELAEVEKVKGFMHDYFYLTHYASGGLNIDHQYTSKYVDVIAEFMGLFKDEEEGNHGHEED